MGRPKKFSRNEVLEKALPLFWQQGFANTCLQDLERATGVNKSGLYSEFKDKEDIFLSSLRLYLDCKGGQDILTAEPLGWANIEGFFKIVGQGSLRKEKGCFAVNSMRELPILPDEAQTLLVENRNRLKKIFQKNIAAEKTQLPADALAEILSTFFSGICIETNLSGSKAALVRKIDDMLRLLRSA